MDTMMSEMAAGRASQVPEGEVNPRKRLDSRVLSGMSGHSLNTNGDAYAHHVLTQKSSAPGRL
jgi:hypothetical protein